VLTGVRAAVVLDPAGRVVWLWPTLTGRESELVTRVRLGPEGEHLLELPERAGR